VTGPDCKYFYLCGKEPGFCGHEGPCENKLCFHTTKESQAKNKVGRKFVLIESPFGAERWEYETEEEYKRIDEIKREVEGAKDAGDEKMK